MVGRPFAESSESGSAILQVLVVGTILAITGYVYMEMTVQNDKNATRWIQRTTNLNMGANLANYVNDRVQIYDIAVTPAKDSGGTAIPYP